MTSSLVGSEMCIRDRMSSSIVDSESRVVSLQQTPESQRVPAASVVCAVSYTHLTLPTICSV
eukprot:1212004-Prorocentrum_lima.AAC.1